MTPVLCIIPARISPSRFPGKPLVSLRGRPMILRTMDRARAAGCFKDIACATDSEKIASVVESAGYRSVMTGECATGSDRVYEAAEKLGWDLVVNLQGDEPVADVRMIRDVALALAAEPDSWVTAYSPLLESDIPDMTVVKVKVERGYATAFCRRIQGPAAGWNVHRGIYAYSRAAREEFHSLPQTAEEKRFSLEQMRILGKRPIRVIGSTEHSMSVDVPQDVAKMENLIQGQDKYKTVEI